jgi:serine/threonine protein kinase
VPADLAARDLDGVVIGRYRLRQVIGRGGSSAVYRAINDDRPDLPSVVAIKVADDEQCREPDFRRQFHAQSRVSAAVDHPSVLPVLDSGEHLGRPFLVMPYIQGADLARQLNAQALTVGRVLVLLRQVADGLDAMHRAGVLHLDVKPANVLVGRVHPGEDSPSRTDACPDAAYLTDLGLCRFLSEGSGTSGGVVDFVGSPRYSSPEHLRGRPVRPSSDVYSMACMLFACLAGHPPYVGDVPAVVTGHLSGRVPSLADLTALPRCLDRVVRRGMHPDPASRFGSCLELITRARLAIVDGAG